MIRVAVFGATGRMGQTLCRLIAEAEDLQLVGAATEPGRSSSAPPPNPAMPVSARTPAALPGCQRSASW
jgi:dihydrodipicolinate reductase